MKNMSSISLKTTAMLVGVFSILGIIGSIFMFIKYSKERPEFFFNILMIVLAIDIVPILLLILAVGLWKERLMAVKIAPFFCVLYYF